MSIELIGSLLLGFLIGLVVGSETALRSAEEARRAFGPGGYRGSGDTPPGPPPPGGTACMPVRKAKPAARIIKGVSIGERPAMLPSWKSRCPELRD